MKMETAFPIARSKGRSLSNSLFDPLSEALDKFFDAPFTLRMPRANVTESADEVEIELVAPGLEKTDFSVKADGKVLNRQRRKRAVPRKETKRLLIVGNTTTLRFPARSYCLTWPL